MNTYRSKKKKLLSYVQKNLLRHCCSLFQCFSFVVIRIVSFFFLTLCFYFVSCFCSPISSLALVKLRSVFFSIAPNGREYGKINCRKKTFLFNISHVSGTYQMKKTHTYFTGNTLNMLQSNGRIHIHYLQMLSNRNDTQEIKKVLLLIHNLSKCHKKSIYKFHKSQSIEKNAIKISLVFIVTSHFYKRKSFVQGKQKEFSLKIHW